VDDGYRVLHARVDQNGAGDLVPSSDSLAAIFDLLDKFYSLGRDSTRASIPALRPDYLGELFVLDHLERYVTGPHAQRALLRAALTTGEKGLFAFFRRMTNNHLLHESVMVLVNRAWEVLGDLNTPIPAIRRSGELELLLGGISDRCARRDDFSFF
jgi:hypothetical protein